MPILFYTCVVSSTSSNIRALFQSSISLINNKDRARSALELLNNFSLSLREKSFRHVFKFFSAKSSGVLLDELQFPPEGYGFFGWIRADKTAAAQTNACLWQFAAVNQFSFKLCLIGGRFIYVLGESPAQEVVLGEELAFNRWHFVELYHTSCGEIVSDLIIR